MKKGRIQGCGNIQLIAGHLDPFSTLLSCSIYIEYTAQFQFTGHSLDLSDNVLHDWLFPHHWTYLLFTTSDQTFIFQPYASYTTGLQNLIFR